MQKNALPIENNESLRLAVMMIIGKQHNTVQNVHAIEKIDFNFQRKQKIASYQGDREYSSYLYFLPMESGWKTMPSLKQLGWKGNQFPEFLLDENWYKSSQKDWKPRVFIASQIPAKMNPILEKNAGI